MAFINICHHCKKAVEPSYDATFHKAYVCPYCRKPFTDTYAIISKEWEKWSEEKRQEYIQASLNGTKKEFFEKYPVIVDKAEQKKSEKKSRLLLAVPLILGIVCLPIMPLLSVIFFALFIFFMCIRISVKKDLGVNYELNEIIRYDATTYTIHLFKRDHRIADYVKIKDARNIHIKYEPKKLHIGAVSVGGVTTGGAYTTGGYNYVSGTTKSGFAQLEYKGNIVHYIQLNKDLYNQAKNSPVAEYLNHDTKQIRAHGNGEFTQADIEKMLTNYATTGFTGNFDQTKATFAQCEQIVAWMCGDQ